MKRSARKLRADVAAILCAAAATALISARPAAATDWPQAHSDMPADPAVLFGTLPNGMRYAIMHNATPKNAVAMRFCIEAGSLQESDAQQGLAHFLEHMAFRGSRHVPKTQVYAMMQRLGMGLGADLNAGTTFTQTDYKLNLPRNDVATIDGGLLWLRDIAGELTLDQHAMDEERGVILSEERWRDTPAFRAYKQRLRLLIPGAPALSRFPIGKTEVIKHAPVSLIRDFYDAYYRPERATLIVVGDVDPKAMQAKILNRFADWKPVGPAGKDPSEPSIGPRAPQAQLFVDPGQPSALILDWATPSEPDTKARERTDLTDIIGLLILDNRLQDLANGPQPPFVGLQPSFGRFPPTAYFQSILIATKPQDWHRAVDAAIITARQLVKYGVTADEMSRAEKEFLAILQAAAAEAGTRTSPNVADALAKSVDEGEVFASPVYALSFGMEILKGLSVETVNARLRHVLSNYGPLLSVDSPSAIEGGQASVAAALAAAEKAPLPVQKAATHVAWPYTNFGTPGQVINRKLIADLQTTFIRFANGVRLTVKPTKFTIGDIRIGVKLGDGRLGLPIDRISPEWAFSGDGFVLGGLKAISYGDLARTLAGKRCNVQTSVLDNGLWLEGQTRPADFTTELQLLAAYVSAPGWRAGAIDRARGEESSVLVGKSATPDGVFERDIASLLHSGDKRWATPSKIDVATLKPDDLKAMFETQLAAAPIDVTIVGDITVDQAVQAVAATFGALPARGKPTAASSGAVHFPAGTPTPIVLHHHGRADQGDAVIAWPAVDGFDVTTRESLVVLKNAFVTRLTDQLRIRDAVTYSPFGFVYASDVLPGFGYFLAATELSPAKMPLFFDVASSIAADLKAHPISADELIRSRKPSVEQLIMDWQTNTFWLSQLSGVQANPRILEIIRDEIPDLEHVTSADVQRVAQKYLIDAKAWKAEITPDTMAGAH